MGGAQQPSWDDDQIRTYSKGDSFGEVAVLAGTCRTAWVMARCYCITSTISQNDLLNVLHNHPGSFLLLVQKIITFQHMQLKDEFPWSLIKRWLMSRFDSTIAAFSWIGGFEDSFNFDQFQTAMVEMGMPLGLEMRIRWAELDKFSAGQVDFEVFEDRVGLWTDSDWEVDEVDEETTPSCTHITPNFGCNKETVGNRTFSACS